MHQPEASEYVELWKGSDCIHDTVDFGFGHIWDVKFGIAVPVVVAIQPPHSITVVSIHMRDLDPIWSSFILNDCRKRVIITCSGGSGRYCYVPAAVTFLGSSLLPAFLLASTSAHGTFLLVRSFTQVCSSLAQLIIDSFMYYFRSCVLRKIIMDLSSQKAKMMHVLRDEKALWVRIFTTEDIWLDASLPCRAGRPHQSSATATIHCHSCLTTPQKLGLIYP